MKKVFTVALIVFLLILWTTALADDERTSGLFTYKLKGNGTAVITGFDWKENPGQDVYVPRLIDGYTVTEIGAFAFSDNSLTDDFDWHLQRRDCPGDSVTVIIPDTVTVIGEKAFFRTRVNSVPIPASVKLIGTGAFAGCYNLNTHFVDKGNETYTTIDGVLYNKKAKELVSFASEGLATQRKIEIPKGIISIGDYAFFGFRLASGIEFPDTLHSIGKSAFAYAQIGGTIEIKGAKKQLFSFNKVAEIGDHAFANAIIDGVFDFNNSQIETIGDYAFDHVFITNDAVKDISKNEKAYQGILNIVFPSSLKILGEGSFNYFLKDLYSENIRIGTYFYEDIGNILLSLDFSKTKLTMISDYAFSRFGFNSLEEREVVLPDSLQYIGNSAFFGINKGKGIRIMIPSSVEIIDNSAFCDTDLALSFEDEPSALTTIGDKAFYHSIIHSENDTMVLPYGLKKIGDSALDIWESASTINKIVIPSSVTSLGDSFCDRAYIALIVEPDSYAALYASENGYTTVDAGGEDTSWLDE